MIATIRAAAHAIRRHRKTRRGWPLNDHATHVFVLDAPDPLSPRERQGARTQTSHDTPPTPRRQDTMTAPTTYQSKHGDPTSRIARIDAMPVTTDNLDDVADWLTQTVDNITATVEAREGEPTVTVYTPGDRDGFLIKPGMIAAVGLINGTPTAFRFTPDHLARSYDQVTTSP